MLYSSLLRSVLFRLPAETAHELALKSLASAPSFVTSSLARRYQRSPFGKLKRFGLMFDNPVGLAAGFDKDGIGLLALASLGFGFIEAGTVTFHPQPGNPKPRLFRLPLDQALINRAGFNNEGAEAFVRRVSKARPDCVLGVSIGKSKVTPFEDAVADYLKTFDLVNDVADYIAVNVSSPNTPRLRELQHGEHLDQLLGALQKRNRELAEKHGQKLKPFLLKLSPDLSDDELTDAISVAQRREIAGVIATNTTTDRSHLQTDANLVARYGEGGLSGAPLKTRATTMVSKIYKMTGGTLPVIGVGGIFTANDAFEMIAAGASLIQIYTGFIYEGPSIVANINDGLRRIVSREGFVSLDEAVGSGVQ
ncbi:MAG TPA: quinone-dependent dihydroorotate dehydrogenase [Pyrinomonadaceae bacterium]|nr:quinone-dependent dihydroorotate dehydrogenase [Pyrinomonadaceae bacterium]